MMLPLADFLSGPFLPTAAKQHTSEFQWKERAAMPVPKFRTSASKRDMRRSHHALKGSSLSSCTNCGNMHRPHQVCPSCGYYRGKQALEVEGNQESFGEGTEKFGSE